MPKPKNRRGGSALALTSGVFASLVIALCPSPAKAQPAAVAPYTLSAFPGVPPSAGSPPTQVFDPDDLAVSGDGADLWVAYQNGGAPDGSGGASSNIVEYEISTGTVLKNITIAGHTDGLKINPRTGQVWTTQNEDANPTLAIINPTSGKFKLYGFVNPTAHGGGYDDLVFAGSRSQDVFLSCSNPSSPLTNQAIAEIDGKPKKMTKVTEVIAGNATAYNVVTGATETLAISDSDSMTLDPAGELVLDSQGDDELIVVRNPSATNPVLKIPLTLNGSPTEVNDTIFTSSASGGVASTAGMIFISDTDANVIYELAKPYFPANEIYAAADAAGDVGLLDMNSGKITPVVTGLQHPNGLAFAPTAVAYVPAKIKK